MTHATYDSYKESGVPWLGKVPNHWEVARLKTTCAYTKNGVWGADADGEDDIPCIRVADFNRKKFSVSDKKLTLRAVNPSDRIGRILEIGDLLLEKSGGGDKQLVGAVVIYRLPFPAVCSNFVAKIKVASGHEPQFITYLHAHLYAGKVNYRSIKQTTGIQNLDSESYFNEKVSIPPLTEQKAIAEFLDTKTAQIDSLIAKKKNLLKLLAEQRTALITNAVTRGLDGSAPMKESGITWLGKVPNHWEVKRLRFLLSEPLKYGANESAEFEDRTNPRYIRITDVNEDGSLREETFKSLPEEVAAPYILDDGDILLARSGSIGLSFIYRKSWGRAAYAGYLIRARLHKSNDTQFIYRYLNSKTFWDWLNSVFIQSTIKNVNAEKYGNLPVPIPPLAEQKAIADFLDCKTAEIDATKDRITTAIDTLKEYRTALITNAVTGKIKVV